MEWSHAAYIIKNESREVVNAYQSIAGYLDGIWAVVIGEQKRNDRIPSHVTTDGDGM